MNGCERDYSKKIITIPNALSVVRLCLIPVCIWLYCVEANYRLTAVVFIISGGTDIVDGWIARRFHMISNVGKVLDPIADKLTQAAMLFCLVTRFRYMAVVLILMVVKELIAAVTGVYVIRKTGKVLGAVWHGKLNTVLLHTLLLVHLVWTRIPPEVSHVMISVCVIMMLISCCLYALRNLQEVQGGALK